MAHKELDLRELNRIEVLSDVVQGRMSAVGRAGLSQLCQCAIS
ncbi:hypothetical protein CSE45_5460 [Citreicella sp. SE45]|nr:hypothetical protein CSE45_5460 [Citreicella sp. SE45]